jgi:CysZ protein
MSAPSRPRDFVTGIGLLGKGLGMYARSPGLLLLGILPALLAFVLLAGAFVLVLYFIGPESRALTWFADSWPSGARELIRVLAGVAIIVVFVFLALIFYTALALAVGDPFYEKISQRVEALYGDGANPVNLPWWKELARSVGEAIRLVIFSALIAALVFVIGLIPVVGQVAAPVIGTLVGGWALAVELTGIPFARRGLRLRERRRVLRQHRWLTLGFGVSVAVCFLIPLGALLVMPAAVAGATLLTRQIHGQRISIDGYQTHSG